MKIWGLVSSEHETKGYDAITDAQGNVLIRRYGEVMACYDPVDYTLPGLRREVGRRLQEAENVPVFSG